MTKKSRVICRLDTYGFEGTCPEIACEWSVFQSYPIDPGTNATQAYLNYLENGERRLTPELVRRATSVYGLALPSLPVADVFTPVETSDQHLAEALPALGYPGLRYLRSHTVRRRL